MAFLASDEAGYITGQVAPVADWAGSPGRRASRHYGAAFSA
jgi:hypothetical protein